MVLTTQAPERVAWRKDDSREFHCFRVFGEFPGFTDPREWERGIISLFAPGPLLMAAFLPQVAGLVVRKPTAYQPYTEFFVSALHNKPSFFGWTNSEKIHFVSPVKCEQELDMFPPFSDLEW